MKELTNIKNASKVTMIQVLSWTKRIEVQNARKPCQTV